MRFLFCFLFSCIIIKAKSQSLELGNPPNFILPTPEVSNKLRADFLSASQNSGAINFSFPIYALTSGNYTLPITLNYNSAGVKVDDIASMVGMGWSLNYGGLVSRTVMDIPDEYRLGGENNLNSHNLANPDYALIDYFENESLDKQSDIFSFSFPGHSGKFIMDSNFVPKPLSQYNIKIQIIDTWSLDGFIIITDDGTQYYFQDEETSIDRPKTGTNCKQGWGELSFDEVKTSWYLTKIILPNRQRTIDFFYDTHLTRFKANRFESVSLNIATEYYECSLNQIGPTGPACTVNQSFYTNCLTEQFVQTKFISRIETSEGERIEFYYDGSNRQDLMGGKRLSYIKSQNYLGNTIKYIHFYSSYQQAINGSSDYESRRMFLDSFCVRNNQNDLASQVKYFFKYNNYSNLPKRLSAAQDVYGFYNGKNSNTSLIPKLKSTDINYTVFNNGTGLASVSFGDRNIDSNYLVYGMLTGIYYPTGGRDSILYNPNYKFENQQEILCGGLAVKKICSYTVNNQLASEKEFIYRSKEGILSSFFPSIYPSYSQRRTVKRDGYICFDSYTNDIRSIHCVGPACTNAIVTSNANYPVTADGSQHVYFNSVLELQKNGGVSTGVIEHKYKFYQANGLLSEVILGSEQMGMPYNIVPELYTGEEETNYYKMNGSILELVSSKVVEFENRDQGYIYNYFVRKNYQAVCTNRPNGTITIDELNGYDVTRGRIYFNTPVIKSVTEKTIDNNGNMTESHTEMEYNTLLYTYPKLIKVTNSKGVEERIEKSYPPDYTTLNFMVNRNIINPVIEEKKYSNNILLSTNKVTYIDLFSNGNIIVPQSVEVKNPNNSIREKTIYKKYDSFGNLLLLSKENGADITYLWGYKGLYPVAKVTNTTDVIASGYINQNTLNNPTDEISFRTHLGNLRNISGALATTYTYTPSLGMTSETDPNGRTTYYEYDGFGRLSLIKDQDKKILKKYCYNYFGQQIDCTTNINPFWTTTGTTRCQTNSNGNTGYLENEERDANPNSSTYTQTRWVTGTYNTTTCPLPNVCNSSNCTGNNKRCVNGICETGIKVYTDAVPKPGGWTCTYHYEWSDGYWSDDYFENSPTACPY